MKIIHKYRTIPIDKYENLQVWDFLIQQDNQTFKGTIKGDLKPGSFERVYTAELESDCIRKHCSFNSISIGYANVTETYKYLLEAIKLIIVNHNYTIVTKYGQVEYFPK